MKSARNTTLNAKHQGAAMPMPNLARMVRTRLSLGESNGAVVHQIHKRRLDIVAELSDNDRRDYDRYWNTIENAIALPDRKF